MSSPVDQRLLQAITAPLLQSHAAELVHHASVALVNLQRLDENLYERFVASRRSPGTHQSSPDSLRQLWADTFTGVASLLKACDHVLKDRPTGQTTDDGLGFDFGDLEGGSAPASAETGLDLGAGDIGSLLDGIDEHKTLSEGDKWNQVLEKVSSIEYGLRSQQEDGLSRLEVALGSGRPEQGLEVIDDTQSSASEGVYALVAAVVLPFVPDADPANLVAGYLTSLERALLVRRGLAELAEAVNLRNAVLQEEDPDQVRHEPALAALRHTMAVLVGGDVFRSMRPADRWQLARFEADLREQPVKAARLTSEGLAKYLESLSSISQREVLVLHDQRVLGELQELLLGARQLVEVSRKTAFDMLKKAYTTAFRLYGRHPGTDIMLSSLREQTPDFGLPDDNAALLVTLEELLHAAGKAG